MIRRFIATLAAALCFGLPTLATVTATAAHADTPAVAPAPVVVAPATQPAAPAPEVAPAPAVETAVAPADTPAPADTVVSSQSFTGTPVCVPFDETTTQCTYPDGSYKIVSRDRVNQVRIVADHIVQPPPRPVIDRSTVIDHQAGTVTRIKLNQTTGEYVTVFVRPIGSHRRR